MMMVFLKSTVRPWESVIRPSSRTCKQYVKDIRMCFFHLIKQNDGIRFSTEQLRSADHLHRIQHILEVLRSVWIQSISPCIHSYQCRTILCSSSNRLAASAFASSVLPTPVGPRNRNEPIGLLGSLIPALERMIASVTFVTPSSCPMTRLCSSSSRCRVLLRSLSVSFATGIPVQREMILAISSSVTLSCTRDRSLFFHLFFFVLPAASASCGSSCHTAVLLPCSRS